MASVRSIDDALQITLNTNGRVIRNLIHGADTVMSHILHFYHLAAADFVNVSPAPGILGSPWDDGSGGFPFGTTSAVQLCSLTQVNTLNDGITNELVESYVMALNMRKEAHTMGAIFSGRQPIQNAVVPGGVTTLFTQNDIDTFKTKLNTVRNFINRYYIPDVVFVATRTNISGDNWSNLWFAGTNPGKLLSYGEYPLATAEAPFRTITDNSKMALARGIVNYDLSYELFDTTKIAEYVEHSYYSSANGLHPSVGVTTPDVTLVSNTNATQYSWLKAPRYGGAAAEVGPLARMVASYALGNATASDTDGTDVTSLDSMLSLGLPPTYNVQQLVNLTLKAASNIVTPGTTTTVGAQQLFSPLGRHAARALECKFVADSMYAWLSELTTTAATTDTLTGHPFPYTTTVGTGSGYVYKAIPSNIVSGEGLAEAPRGALGHWINIQSKKIANYQCVVPSTWNAGPKGNGVNGPAEQAVIGLTVGTNKRRGMHHCKGLTSL